MSVKMWAHVHSYHKSLGRHSIGLKTYSAVPPSGFSEGTADALAFKLYLCAFALVAPECSRKLHIEMCDWWVARVANHMMENHRVGYRKSTRQNIVDHVAQLLVIRHGTVWLSGAQAQSPFRMQTVRVLDYRKTWDFTAS